VPTTPRPTTTHSRSTEHPTTRPAGRRPARGARARRAAAWGGAVLLLGTSALALSACGSSSPPDSAASTSSPAVAKQAGLTELDVHMTVVNLTYQNVDVELCGENMWVSMGSDLGSDTCEKHTLGPMRRTWPISGTWNTAEQTRYGAVQGIIRLSPVGVTFEAFNPAISRPGFRLASAADFTQEKLQAARNAGSPPGYEPFAHNPTADDGTSTEDLRFDEQQSMKYSVNGHPLQLDRLTDDGYKEMRITILPLGG
jgi:hypothetical protein